MTFLSLFPAYRLMESITMDARREAEGLRAEAEIARQTAAESRARFEEERAELKELRREYVESIRQTANFMAYAKTNRMIFVAEDSILPQPAPPVTNEQIKGKPHARDLVAKARRQFDDDLAAYASAKSEAA